MSDALEVGCVLFLGKTCTAPVLTFHNKHLENLLYSQ